ncbi:hypothetical protein TNCV_4259251 [Trichonephila clavipes]|nr:hypothetical protein TNCV_4259251 [Trichonephila clavipes]
MVDKKTSDCANCKEQLVSTVRGEKWLRRIVRSQRCQTLVRITTQLNYGASRIVSKRTASSYGFQEQSTYESTIARTL